MKGTSALSPAGNGAIILATPDAPVNLNENVAQRTISTLGITWQNGLSDGGSPIIDYRVTIDEQAGS